MGGKFNLLMPVFYFGIEKKYISMIYVDIYKYISMIVLEL